MKKIIINDPSRRAKTVEDGAPFFHDAMRGLDKSDTDLELVVPGIWSWADLPDQFIQFNMFELAKSLVGEFGKDFEFGCRFEREKKELCITARRIVK